MIKILPISICLLLLANMGGGQTQQPSEAPSNPNDLVFVVLNDGIRNAEQLVEFCRRNRCLLGGSFEQNKVKFNEYSIWDFKTNAIRNDGLPLIPAGRDKMQVRILAKHNPGFDGRQPHVAGRLFLLSQRTDGDVWDVVGFVTNRATAKKDGLRYIDDRDVIHVSRFGASKRHAYRAKEAQ